MKTSFRAIIKRHPLRQTTQLHPRVSRALLSGGVASLALLYWFPLRRWFFRWGTTPDERTRAMPGDDVITHPTDTAMQAITVEAPPDDIWPWLVQMDDQRGGLYSYDWLDRFFGFLGHPSADRVLPEYQHLEVGDTISLGLEAITTTLHTNGAASRSTYSAHDTLAKDH